MAVRRTDGEARRDGAGVRRSRATRERRRALRRLEARLEIPMLVLGLVWLGLLVLELTRGLSPLLQAVGTGIWVVFLLEFALRLAIAPAKGAFLARNWLAALSLAVPALRVFRAARVARLFQITRATRGLRLVRVVGSVSRGMKGLGRTMGRRGAGYVLALTAIVLFAGAAGMYAFEREAPGGGLPDYGTALWWTAMIMATLGSDYWPRTVEGRLLCLLLAAYAFAVFGYVTATLASFFIEQDASDPDVDVAGAEGLEALRDEVRALGERLGAEAGVAGGATQRGDGAPRQRWPQGIEER